MSLFNQCLTSTRRDWRGAMTTIVDMRQEAERATDAGCRAFLGDRGTGVRRHPSRAAASAGLPQGRRPARRRHAVCFICEHLVPKWNNLPCSAPATAADETGVALNSGVAACARTMARVASARGGSNPGGTHDQRAIHRLGTGADAHRCGPLPSEPLHPGTVGLVRASASLRHSTSRRSP
jgi:hypothetical protein